MHAAIIADELTGAADTAQMVAAVVRLTHTHQED
jgi:hypothetical protein